MGDADKVPKSAGRGNLTGGSRKGKPNKNTKALKDMILGALDRAGGQEYLQRQADENPNAFLSLIGKVLPTEVKGDMNQRVEIKVVSEFNDREQ